MNIFRSNVHCTNCGRDFSCELDLSLSGNHTIVCPHCQHEHFRVVRDGEVTEDRWKSSGPTYSATTSTTMFANVSTMYLNTDTASLTTSSTMQLWLNRSDLNWTTT